MAESSEAVSPLIEYNTLFNEIFQQITFRSFEEFEQLFTQYKQSTGSVYRVKTSCSIEADNQHRTNPRPLALKYASVTFVCVHYGEPRKNGQGIRKKQRYLPCGCESLISLSASNDQLRLTRSVLAHNHALKKELQPFYTQHRRLNKDQEKQVEEIVKLNPGNKQLKKFISTKFSKVVTLQDVRNMKKKVKFSAGLSDMEELFDIVKEMEGQGKVQILIDDDNVIKMIAFATDEMMDMYSKFPEFICLDGTYKVNKYHYPLYLVHVQDNLGRGRSVFYAFVKNETAEIIQNIVQAFCDMMGDSSKTKTVMLDKDQNEIQAVRSLLPDATVLLCKFHTIKCFKKKVSELVKPVDEKNKIFSLLKQLVYAKNESMFDDILVKLREEDEDLHEYIVDNWVSCKEMWVDYLRSGTLTFGNDTNNRIESENGKLKQLLSTTSTMAECIRKLCFYNEVLNDERHYQQFLHKCTNVEYGCQESDLSDLYALFTEHAVSKMLENHKVLSEVTPDVSQLSNCLFCVKIGTSDRTVSWDGTDYSCTCAFQAQYQLPCRHIIALVRHEEADITQLGVASRWRKTNTAIPRHISLSRSSLGKSPHRNHFLSSAQKYNNSQDTIQRLNAVLTNCGTAVHLERLELLKKIIGCWEKNEKVAFPLNAQSASCQSTQDVSMDPHSPGVVMESAPAVEQEELEQISVEFEFQAKKSEAEPSSEIEEAQRDQTPTPVSIADQMRKVQAHLPVVKCRGRPRESRTVGQFNQTQRKRKASGQASSRKKAKKAMSQECTLDLIPENPHSLNTCDEAIDNSICYICFHEDPPREVSRNPQTEWTDCDKDCGRWFHTACIKHLKVPVVGYKCNKCE